MVAVDTIQQKNVIQLCFILQNEATSSIANNKPPTGDPKAAETPAPTPAFIKSRLDLITKILLPPKCL